MARLTRVETQELTRHTVLDAAYREFTERGFRDAKIDSIAERADLTRGAVYSNFPGKRALYLEVLAGQVELGPPQERGPVGDTPRSAIAALARAWLARLPMADGLDEPHGAARLGLWLESEVLADEQLRRHYAQLMKLDGLLLGLALERLESAGRRVRAAEAVLTTLHGARGMAAAAPGYLEPFDVIKACERLVELDVDDTWPTPPIVADADLVDEPWAPTFALSDIVSGRKVGIDHDGVHVVLGPERLAAAEDAVRAAPPGVPVTIVMVAPEVSEAGPLARYVVGDLCACIRQAFPRMAWPRVTVAWGFEDMAEAVRVEVGPRTEVAVRVIGDRVVARASGIGAGHAVAGVRDRR
ncbi:TetR family transcriptional regulator [Labedaea rhizosphaerae]|uniref:TetR family transcriptional regulator n=1 Tax=Labedaea rhizosphaerae TaxID=598644 RepID=A0A4R6SQR0_LABRH|nr:TetR family transcriptional regulator [Labedaea rhizosphaerae]TDQ05882.1 TetR family transcriptional regulator [Labedaea rhizosphaerae]